MICQLSIDGLTPSRGMSRLTLNPVNLSSCTMSFSISTFPSALVTIYFLAICFNGTALSVRSVEAEESTVVGLKAGDPIGTFRVIKIAGSEDDGVEVGQSLCYRCRYGSNPIVILFARKSSKEIDSLVLALEESLETYQSQKLNALIVLVGDDRSKLNENAAALIERTTVKRIPAVVAEDATSGPLDYQLSPLNDVTAVVAKDSQVVAVESLSIKSIEPKRIIDHIDAMLAP